MQNAESSIAELVTAFWEQNINSPTHQFSSSPIKHFNISTFQQKSLISEIRFTIDKLLMTNDSEVRRTEPMTRSTLR